MIIPSQGLRIVLAVRPVDFRCGHDALAALVQNKLGLDPHSGLIVVFRSKRRDRLKILLWDGTVIGWLGGNVLEDYKLTIDYPNRLTYWQKQRSVD